MDFEVAAARKKRRNTEAGPVVAAREVEKESAEIKRPTLEGLPFAKAGKGGPPGLVPPSRIFLGGIDDGAVPVAPARTTHFLPGGLNVH